MTHVLVRKSSLFGDAGQSSVLADRFIAELRAADADIRVTERNLGSAPLPHLDAATFAALGTAAAERTAEQRQRVALGDTLIAELKAADLLLIGCRSTTSAPPPPSRRGSTMWQGRARHSATPQMARKGSSVYARPWYWPAGVASTTAPGSTQTHWLTTTLGFMGIADVEADVEYVYAEGLARTNLRDESAQHAQAAVSAAVRAIRAASCGQLARFFLPVVHRLLSSGLAAAHRSG